MRVVSKSFLCGLVFFILLGFSFYLFSMKITEVVEKNMEERLVETANHNTASIQTVFKKDIDYLNGIAAQLAKQSELTGRDSISFLHTLVDAAGYSRMTIDLPNGYSYTSDGEVVKLSNVRYLHEALSGKSAVTDVYRSIIDNEPSISVVVPIYKDGVSIGALRAVYQNHMLMKSIDIETFDGAGYFNLVDSNGQFLFKTTRVQALYKGDSLFEILQGAEFQKGYSLQQCRQDIMNEQSGFMMYTLDGEERYVYYKPIGIDHWYMMSVVPSQYLQRQKKDIHVVAALLLSFLLVLFCILIGYIVSQNRRTRRKIEEDRDYLDSVLNNIPVPVFITDNDKKIEFINEVAITLFGKNKDELMGNPCYTCDTCICKTPDCAIDKMIRTGDCHTYLEMKERHYMVRTAYLGANNKRDFGFIEIIQDITEIVEIKDVLEERTLELETISENLLGGVLITTLDRGFPILRCNQWYCDLVGATEEYFVGKFALDLVAPEDAAETERKIYDQLETRGMVSFDHKILNKYGDKVWVSLYGRQTFLHGKPVGVWMLVDITNLKETERQLKINEERYRIASQITEDVILDYNIQTKVIIHTAKVTEIYGVPEYLENAPESIVETGIIAEESVEEFLCLFDRIRSGVPKDSCVLLARAIGEREIWNKLSFTTIYDNEQKPVRAIGILQDITSEQKAKQQYANEVQHREIILQDLNLYYEVDLTKRVFIRGHEDLIAEDYSKATEDYDTVLRLLAERLIYKPDRELILERLSWKSLMEAYSAGQKKITFEYRRIVGMAEFAWVECMLYLLADEETNHVRGLCYVKDINEAKMREMALRKKAERDLLTGLYNKMTTENLIKAHVSSDNTGAFFLIDLDGFKQINDTLGHAFGDAVLAKISKNLYELFGARDIVGRIGGDEFVVFMPTLHNVEQIKIEAERICAVFRSASMVNNKTYKISGSVGISFSPTHGDTFKELYTKADIALYYSKKNGKDKFSIYRADLPQIGSGQI